MCGLTSTRIVLKSASLVLVGVNNMYVTYQLDLLYSVGIQTNYRFRKLKESDWFPCFLSFGFLFICSQRPLCDEGMGQNLP